MRSAAIADALSGTPCQRSLMNESSDFGRSHNEKMIKTGTSINTDDFIISTPDRLPTAILENDANNNNNYTVQICTVQISFL